jgi:hypothetical protein
MRFESELPASIVSFLLNKRAIALVDPLTRIERLRNCYGVAAFNIEKSTEVRITVSPGCFSIPALAPRSATFSRLIPGVDTKAAIGSTG